MGFSGLAASKNQIRESTNLVGLMITYIPMILPLIASYLFILIILLKKKISIFRSYYLISFLVGISIFVTFAFIFKFRFWGRHLLYLYPFFILFISDVLTEYYCEIRNMKKIYSGISTALLSFIQALMIVIIRINISKQKSMITANIIKTKFESKPSIMTYDR